MAIAKDYFFVCIGEVLLQFDVAFDEVTQWI